MEAAAAAAAPAQDGGVVMREVECDDLCLVEKEERAAAAYDSAVSVGSEARRALQRAGESSVMHPSTDIVGGSEVRFVPFAHFKTGGTVVTRAVGYHSDGDLVVFREEESSAQEVSGSDVDAAGVRVRRRRSNLTTSQRIEQPLNPDKIDAKGLRAFPGVAGPRSKQKHRRWRNQFFIEGQQAMAAAAAAPEAGGEGGGASATAASAHHPARMTKETFQLLYTHRPTTEFQFHDDEGEVNTEWAPFVEVTEEKQAALLRKVRGGDGPAAPRVPQGGEWGVERRWLAIGKPLRLELVKVSAKRQAFITPVEQRLAAYVKEVDAACEACEEPTPLVLKFDDGYHRLLCHGVVTFYGLTSASTTGDDGERYTVIQTQPSAPRPHPLPAITLLEHLTAISEQVWKERKKGVVEGVPGLRAFAYALSLSLSLSLSRPSPHLHTTQGASAEHHRKGHGGSKKKKKGKR